MQVKRNIIVSIALIMSFFQVASTQNATGNEYYEKAYTEMADMLEGKSPISIRRAVFMAEWAYLDGNLDYEKDFCERYVHTKIHNKSVRILQDESERHHHKGEIIGSSADGLP